MLYGWLAGFWKDITGKHGYRILGACAAVYVFFYQEERQSFQLERDQVAQLRATFFALATQDDPPSFQMAMDYSYRSVAALCDPQPPSLPTWWYATWYKIQFPSTVDQWLAAKLRRCTNKTCGDDSGHRISLRNVDLSGMNVNSASFDHADLEGSTLSRSRNEKNLKLTSRFCAGPQDVDFGGPSLLENAIFNGSNLRYSRFEDAELTWSYFSNATLDCANFQSINNGVAGGFVAGPDDQFDGEIIMVGKTSLLGTDFSDANLRYAVIEDAEVGKGQCGNTTVKTSFLRANLSRATLVNLSLANADLRGADLSEARLENVDLRGAITDTNTKLPAQVVQNGNGTVSVSPQWCDKRVIAGVHVVPCKSG